jgi:hypothetical protein
MRITMKGAAIALLLAGTAFSTVGTASASDNYGNDNYRNDNYRNDNYSNDQPNGAVSVQFNDVSMGYRDGYWDNNHGWHRWNNDGDFRAYRYRHADTYRDWNHDRNGNDGVVTVSFSDVSMGYRDGYWDNERRWHRWNNDGDTRMYRFQHANTYRDYNHDRDAGNVTIGFGNIAYGYRDGYWDNGHRWHHWRHRGDYRGYRDRSGSNYHDMNHDRENNGGWQGR